MRTRQSGNSSRRRRSRRSSDVSSKKRKVSFRQAVVLPVMKSIKGHGHRKRMPLNELAKYAYASAKEAVRRAGGRQRIRVPRIIPVPRVGGILPLIPILSGIAALGSLIGGASGVVKTINAAKAARSELGETTRHNKQLEAIALGKKGSGLYLKKYRKGLGLYLPRLDRKN